MPDHHIGFRGSSLRPRAWGGPAPRGAPAPVGCTPERRGEEKKKETKIGKRKRKKQKKREKGKRKE